MLRDITLGQYYQTDSVLHRMDSRVKLVATVIFILSLFVVDNFWGYLLAAAFLVVCAIPASVILSFQIRTTGVPGVRNRLSTTANSIKNITAFMPFIMNRKGTWERTTQTAKKAAASR